MKIVVWILANGATLLGLLQALLKVVKELVTGVVNIISLFLPLEVAEDMVKSLRAFLNTADDFIENIKKFFLKK
jgi:hypothetical protein